MTSGSAKKETKKAEMLEAMAKRDQVVKKANSPADVEKREMKTPEKAPHPFAGVEVFSFTNQNVCSTSNAEFIYLLLETKDKQLLMMLMLPHIRKTLMDGTILDPVAVAELLEWDKKSVAYAIKRIRRLCFFGAIVAKPGVGWVTNSKLSSIVSLNK